MSLSRPLRDNKIKNNLKSLKDKIICKVCNKQYVNPKTLPCLHSFCASCIEMMRIRELESSKVTCPECNKEVDIKDNLADGYQTNRYIAEYNFLQKVYREVDTTCEKCTGKSVKASSFCESCGKFVCDLCVTIHRSWSEFASHKLLSMSDLRENHQKYIPDPTPHTMCIHHGKECTIYCETCRIEICHECIVRHHREHKYDLVVDSSKVHKAALLEKLQTIETVPSELDEAIEKLSELVGNLSQMGKDARESFNQAFDRAESAIAQHRKALISELTTVVDRKVQVLEEQKSSLECVKSHVTSCQDFVAQTIAGKHTAEFFVLEQKMINRISDMESEFQSTDLTPVEEPEVHFTVDDQWIKRVPQFGKISDGSVLYVGCQKDNQHQLFTQPVFTLNEIASFYIALSSSFYKIRNNPAGQISAVIRSIREGTVNPVTVAIGASGFAKIQCSFAERGRYTLTVQIDGKHIVNSPCTFFIKPPSTHFHTTVRSITKVSSPRGITVNNKHQMIISQENAHTITVFGRKFRKVLSFGTQGSDEGQFNHPSGITVDSSSSIYVSDSKNNRVQKFDPEGNYLGEFTGEKSEIGSLRGPMGVKVDKHGDVYIVDRGNKRVVVLDSDLQYKSSFGSLGNESTGQLCDPWDIAFDSNDCRYVTDVKLHRILVYSPSGNYRGLIGGMGSQKSRLNRPSGIAIDRFGRIFVCEFGNHRISVFHVNSEFIDCFSAGLSMVNPSSLDIDEDGFVYVASAEAVHVF